LSRRRSLPIPSGFQLLSKVALDDRVNAQPLIVPNVAIGAQGAVFGKFDVVYVATESNTLYAIDANTGRILLSRNLGPNIDPGCGPRVGIESTPVIDLASRTIYLIAYLGFSRPVYAIYALDLATLSDRVPPVTVSASSALADGSSVGFNAIVQRQRPALLLQNGVVYAGFGSFCDAEQNTDPGNQSRGWLLGWHADTLQPLSASVLTDRTISSNLHLSSIWMSGFGIAADNSGLYFVTGNSSDNYPNSNNLAESVVKVSADLSRVNDSFTPFGDPPVCDPTGPICQDMDFGSGGVLALPDQRGSVPHMAVAAGKDGRMFLINRDHMGGLTQQVLDMKRIDGVLGGESYYLNNIVSSGGTKIRVWSVNTAPSPSLTQIHNSPPAFVGCGSGSDGGFLTSISSNGAADAIIWAVTRAATNQPTSTGPPPPSPVSLVAFQPVPGTLELKPLFESIAGTWDSGDNSKIVPVVANGHVYVASNRELDIFGFSPPLTIHP
jgi:hypothetical protein